MMETFIVRVWVPSDPSERGHLRGVVEHVGSGSETTFVGEDELLAMLREPGPTRAHTYQFGKPREPAEDRQS